MNENHQSHRAYNGWLCGPVSSHRENGWSTFVSSIQAFTFQHCYLPFLELIMERANCGWRTEVIIIVISEYHIPVMQCYLLLSMRFCEEALRWDATDTMQEESMGEYFLRPHTRYGWSRGGGWRYYTSHSANAIERRHTVRIDFTIINERCAGETPRQRPTASSSSSSSADK